MCVGFHIPSVCSNFHLIVSINVQIKSDWRFKKSTYSVTKIGLRINCSSDFKNFANSRAFSLKFSNDFSRSLEHFFLTVGHDNFFKQNPKQWPNNCLQTEWCQKHHNDLQKLLLIHTFSWPGCIKSKKLKLKLHGALVPIFFPNSIYK